MSIDLHTFNSPIARRLFLFFFLAVTLPVILLVSVTFFQLSGYMAEQHRKELQNDAKHIGLSLFERLQRVVNELPRLAEASPENGFSDIPVSISAVNQLSLRLANNDVAGRPLWLHPDKADADLVTELGNQLAAGPQPVNTSPIRIHQLEVAGKQGLFVSMRLDTGYLAARLQPDFFWDPEQLPYDKLVCVLVSTGKVMFCNGASPESFVSAFVSARPGSSSGSFEWMQAEKPMRSVYWEVFLKNLGMDSNWAVVLSQPEQELFATTRRFQDGLIVIVLTSILMALMFSIGHLRRVLRPLQTLRDATRRVSEGKLDEQVLISSGDEFEELAVAFNGMTEKLALQFEQREALMELDRLILSSRDSRSVVKEVLLLAKDFPGFQMLLVVVREERTIKLRVVRQGVNKVEEYELADADEINQIMAELEKGGAVGRANLPSWITTRFCGEEDCETWLQFPLAISDSMQGFVILGLQQNTSVDEADNDLAVQVVGRLSTALTRVRWQSELYQQAHFDELTGLPNRAAFKTALENALERSRRHGTRLALLFIDLDRFKLINDSIGHAAGDGYLQAVSKRILCCARREDTVSRLGGDEFTVMIADIPADSGIGAEVMAVVSRLLASIPKPVRIGAHDLRSTLSIGASIFPDDGKTIDDLMKQADTAMYQAKRNGGNSFRFYAQEMQVASQERMELEHDMRRALETDQFVLYFQPQVDALSTSILSAEVLLRWNHPERGLVPPGIFIPIAEESLLIADIDLWVLNAACGQIRRWLDMGVEPVRLAINISAAQFQNPQFVDLVTATLERFELTSDRIELEITEGALIDDHLHSQQVLQDLKMLGVRLALDDFGTGYCSLAYLKNMPIDKLKIDQSFVRDMTRSARDAAIVEVILQLSTQLGLRCIAEGVETKAEFEWLVSKGCEAFQGYLFHRPMPLIDFELLLAK